MQQNNEPLTLDQLNDDCLECIFERIQELPSQLQVARTTHHFRDICVNLWKRSRLYETLCLEVWRETLTQTEDLEYFLKLMRNNIKAIVVLDDCLSAILKDLEDVDIVCLPAVKRCEIEDFLHCSPHDEDMKILLRLVPNLTCLRLSAPVTGRYLANFSHLQELYLYDDQTKDFEIKNEYLQEICDKLRNLRVLDIRSYEISQLNLTNIEQCEKLEVLKLNLNTLKSALNDILKLANLRRLTVLLDNVIDVSRIQNVDTHDYKIYETDEFFQILAAKRDHIVGIAVDNYYMPLEEEWDAGLDFVKYANLQKFAFCNCTFMEDVLIKYTKMKQLRILSIRNWEELTNRMVLNFIKLCPQLTHLDISYCKRLDKQILYDALKILQQQEKTRTQPLNIYYRSSGIEDEVEIVNPSFWQLVQKHINLSNQFPPDSDIGLSYIQRGYEFDFE